jgi:Na+/phosphate symporter
VVEQILDDEREGYRQLVEEMKEVVVANTEVLQKIFGAANDETEKQQTLERKQKLDELNRQLGIKYEVAYKLQKSISKYPADHLVELEELIWSEISSLEEQCLELE